MSQYCYAIKRRKSCSIGYANVKHQCRNICPASIYFKGHWCVREIIIIKLWTKLYLRKIRDFFLNKDRATDNEKRESREAKSKSIAEYWKIAQFQHMFDVCLMFIYNESFVGSTFYNKKPRIFPPKILNIEIGRRTESSRRHFLLWKKSTIFKNIPSLAG